MIVGRIYALVCPIKNDVVYIGSTIYHEERRYYQHLSKIKNSDKPMYQYFRANNIVPEIKLLQKVTGDRFHLMKAEGKWIRKYINAGSKLFNKHNPTGETRVIKLSKASDKLIAKVARIARKEGRTIHRQVEFMIKVYIEQNKL